MGARRERNASRMVLATCCFLKQRHETLFEKYGKNTQTKRQKKATCEVLWFVKADRDIIHGYFCPETTLFDDCVFYETNWIFLDKNNSIFFLMQTRDDEGHFAKMVTGSLARGDTGEADEAADHGLTAVPPPLRWGDFLKPKSSEASHKRVNSHQRGTSLLGPTLQLKHSHEISICGISRLFNQGFRIRIEIGDKCASNHRDHFSF